MNGLTNNPINSLGHRKGFYYNNCCNTQKIFLFHGPAFDSVWKDSRKLGLFYCI